MSKEVQTKALTKYGTTSLAAAAKAREELQEEKESAKSRDARLKLAEGRNVLRMLPPLQGRELPFEKRWIHWLKNPANPDAKGRPVVCPQKERQAKCLICNKVSELRRSGNEMDDRIAGELRAQRRHYANVVDMATPDEGVKIWEFGVLMYDDLLAAMTDSEGVGDFTHPVQGYNLIIERVGNDRNTKYKFRPAKNPSALADMSWLDQMHDLTKVIETIDNEKIRAVLSGEDDGDTSFNPPSDDDVKGGGGGTIDDDIEDEVVTTKKGRR